jgi:predicted nucleic acid-binding protein
VRVERPISADSDDWEEFLSRYLFAGADALHLAMAQSHNLELITADSELAAFFSCRQLWEG